MAAFQALSCDGFWSCLPPQLYSSWIRGRREDKSHSPSSNHLQPRLKHISLNQPKSLPLPNTEVSFLPFLLQFQATSPCPPLCLSPHAGQFSADLTETCSLFSLGYFCARLVVWVCGGCATPLLMQGRAMGGWGGGWSQAACGCRMLTVDANAASEPIPRSYGIRGEAEMVIWRYNGNWGERPETGRSGQRCWQVAGTIPTAARQ